MRILYYFPEVDTFMCQWQRIHFIDELSRHGVEFILFNPLLYGSFLEAYDRMVTLCNKQKIDLFFTGHCHPKQIPIEILQFFKSKGIPTLSIRFDNYVIPYLDEEMSPLFDLVWITSTETKYLYDKFGARTVFAPYAANPFKLKYDESLGLIRKACFIGTPHSSRANLINRLTENDIEVDAFYGKTSMPAMDNQNSITVKMSIPWPGFLKSHYDLLRFSAGRRMLYASVIDKLKGTTAVIENPNLRILPKVSFEELPQKYSQYALSLAFTSLQHTDVLNKPIKIVDLRNFEIPMSGGIEFCRFHEEMASYFEEGKEIVFYKTKDELLDKVRYYVYKASDTEVRAMKAAARKRAENEHTWYLRFSKVLGQLGIAI